MQLNWGTWQINDQTVESGEIKDSFYGSNAEVAGGVWKMTSTNGSATGIFAGGVQAVD